MKKFLIFIILIAITYYQFFAKKEPPIVQVNAIEAYEDIYLTHEKEISRLYEILKFVSESTPEIEFQELDYAIDNEPLILSKLKYNYKNNSTVKNSNVLLFRDYRENTNFKLFHQGADNLQKFSIALKKDSGQEILIRSSIEDYLKRKYYGNWDFFKGDQQIDEKLLDFKETSAKEFFEHVKSLEYAIRTKSKLRINHQILSGNEFKPAILLIDTHLFDLTQKIKIDHSTILAQNSDSIEVQFQERSYQSKEKTKRDETSRMINLDLGFSAQRKIHEYYGLSYRPF